MRGKDERKREDRKRKTKGQKRERNGRKGRRRGEKRKVQIKGKMREENEEDDATSYFLILQFSRISVLVTKIGGQFASLIS